VVQGQFKLTFAYSGTLQANQQVNLAPKISGRLQKLLVDVGSTVKAGDTIAVLEQDSLQLAVQQAQVKLDTIVAGGRPEDIASAQAALDAAQAKLNALKNPSPADLQSAQSTLNSAKADLASSTAALQKLKNPNPADIAAAQAAVDSAQAQLKSAQANLAQVKAPTADAIAAAQAAVDAAKQALTTAEDNWQMAQNGNLANVKGATSSSAVQQAYDAAKASYDAAVQKLNALQNPSPANIQTYQTALDQAQANYNAAAAKLAQLKSPTDQDIQVAQAAVDKAQANVDAAQKKLDQLQNPTENDLTAAQAAVTQAQQTLAMKQKPYTAQDLQTAQLNLKAAQQALADATLVAPFDGVVTQKLVSPGAIVSPSTPVVTIVSSDLQAPVSIEESRLGQLKPGLPVTLSVSSYPGQSFSGKVTSITPSADPKTHTFTMNVGPDDSGGKLKPGMFATVTISTDQPDTIMVPMAALNQVNGKDVVFVVADNKVQMRQVVVGSIGSSNVAIVSGVKPGEQVVVAGAAGLNDGDTVRVQQPASGQPSAQPQQQGSQPQGGQSGEQQGGQGRPQGGQGAPTKQ
jgi:RND family efflux transporter MFP subunit